MLTCSMMRFLSLLLLGLCPCVKSVVIKTVLITEKEREIWHYLCVEDNRGIGAKPL